MVLRAKEHLIEYSKKDIKVLRVNIGKGEGVRSKKLLFLEKLFQSGNVTNLERAITELNQVKKLYGKAIDTNKQLSEQIELHDRIVHIEDKRAYIL